MQTQHDGALARAANRQPFPRLLEDPDENRRLAGSLRAAAFHGPAKVDPAHGGHLFGRIPAEDALQAALAAIFEDGRYRQAKNPGGWAATVGRRAIAREARRQQADGQRVFRSHALAVAERAPAHADPAQGFLAAIGGRGGLVRRLSQEVSDRAADLFAEFVWPGPAVATAMLLDGKDPDRDLPYLRHVAAVHKVNTVYVHRSVGAARRVLRGLLSDYIKKGWLT
jgi:hypothetical protein